MLLAELLKRAVVTKHLDAKRLAELTDPRSTTWARPRRWSIECWLDASAFRFHVEVEDAQP